MTDGGLIVMKSKQVIKLSINSILEYAVSSGASSDATSNLF